MKRTRGRPKKTEEEKRAQIILTLDPKLLKRAKSEIRRGSISRVVEMLLREYLK